MRDHALLGKFIGIWPTEKALRSWISVKWNPKGHITLYLGPKGFLTAVFNCLEDRSRILDGGPYFSNSAGLYLKAWIERFNPDKEDLSYAPVWIRLYSLPWEYWEETSLQEIGNTLGDFVKVAEETKLCRYMSYARICVYMDVKKALLDTVSFFHEDIEWIQVIDYEHVPFRCRKCHDIWHIYRDFPLNKKPPSQDSLENQMPDVLTKVTNHMRGHKKPTVNPKTNPVNVTKPSMRNSFEALEKMDLQSMEKESQQHKEYSKEQLGESSLQPGNTALKKSVLHSNSKSQSWFSQGMEVGNVELASKSSREGEENYQGPQIMEEDLESLDIGDLDILGLEQACKTGNFEKIPEWQVDNLVEVLNKAQNKYSLGVQIGSPWDGKFITKDNKKRGRKTTLERTIKIGEVLVESGRYAKLTKYFPHPSQ